MSSNTPAPIDLSSIDVSNNPAMAALVAKFQATLAENAALKASKRGGGGTVTVKSSALIGETAKDGSPGKGTVGFYGLGVRPITGYANQWAKMVNHGADLGRYILANADRLGFKTPEQREATVRFFTEAMPHLEALQALSLD